MANFLNFKRTSKYSAIIEQHDFALDCRSKLSALFEVGPSMTSSPTQLGLVLDKTTKGSIKPMMYDGKLALIITPYRKNASSHTADPSKPVYQTDHLQVWHNSKGIRVTMNFPRTWSAEDIISKIDDEVYDLCHLYPEKLEYAEAKAPNNSKEDDYIQHFDADV